jgi:GNAT superfamily N-acetyltransferase
VAAVTVWSAGPGKPGLLEAMGVHREHRGLGYGKAITVAAAAALQELGLVGHDRLHPELQRRRRRHLRVSRRPVAPRDPGPNRDA